MSKAPIRAKTAVKKRATSPEKLTLTQKMFCIFSPSFWPMYLPQRMDAPPVSIRLTAPTSMLSGPKRPTAPIASTLI